MTAATFPCILPLSLTLFAILSLLRRSSCSTLRQQHSTAQHGTAQHSTCAWLRGRCRYLLHFFDNLHVANGKLLL
jgi:hypothetical protein